MSRYTFLDHDDGSVQEHTDPDPDIAGGEERQAELDAEVEEIQQ